MRGPALQMESSCQAVKTMAAQFGTATSSQCQRIEDAVAGMRMTRPPQFASQEPCVEVGVMRDQTRGARIPEESKEVRQHLPRGWGIRQICVRDAVYGLGSRRHRPAGIDELLELVGHLSRPAESDGTDLHHPVTLGHQSCRLKIKHQTRRTRSPCRTVQPVRFPGCSDSSTTLLQKQDSLCREPLGFVLPRLPPPIACPFLLPEFRWAAGSQATHRLAHLLGNSLRIGQSCMIALDGTPF